MQPICSNKQLPKNTNLPNFGISLVSAYDYTKTLQIAVKRLKIRYKAICQI